MRNLFLVLVLANFAFAAWHTWFSQPPRAVRPDSDLPSITLVSELPADLRKADETPPASDTPEPTEPVSSAAAHVAEPAVPANDAAVVASSLPETPVGTTATAKADSARCSSVGPFRELGQAATAAANLRAAGYQPTQRVAEGDIWIGYWVYIEAIDSEKQANEILARVREKGIADSYVIPNSDSGNLVSLGVFSEIGGVGKMRDRVRDLGYEPKVVDRTRRATVYWVDVALAGDQKLDFDALQTPGRIIRLEQRPCEAPPA